MRQLDKIDKVLDLGFDVLDKHGIECDGRTREILALVFTMVWSDGASWGLSISKRKYELDGGAK